MYEVEVKVRADHAAVRERLAALGAEPQGTVVQRDTYYDHPERSFAASDEALRVRRERRPETAEDAVTLTYKGPKVDDASKTREEIETAVGDYAAADAVLTALSFDAAAEVEKERERYALDGYVVALDGVDGLGEFVEVEAEGTAEEIDALRDGARDLLSGLGLDPDDQVRESYLELLASR